MNESEITGQDIKNLKEALPVIRALSKVERFLANAETVVGLEAQVKSLNERRNTIAADLSAQQAASIRDTEAALAQAHTAAKARLDALVAQREAAIAAADERLQQFRETERRIQENLLEQKTKLQNDLDHLRQQIREASEVSARNLEAHRTTIQKEQADLLKARAALRAEKEAIETDIAKLKTEKTRIAQELRAVLGGG